MSKINPTPEAFKPTSDTIAVLKRLFAPSAGTGGKYVVRAHADDGSTKPAHILNRGDLAALEPLVIRVTKAITARSLPGKNVHVAPLLYREDLPPGETGKEADAIGAYALVIDADTADLSKLPIKPHLVIETSPGRFQIIYVLDQAYPVAEIKAVVAALCKILACDPGSKLIRVPGTVNYPNAAKRAAGRVPVTVTLAAMTDPDGLDGVAPTISLDALTAAIVAKYPTLTLGAREETSAELDWHQRRGDHSTMTAADFERASNTLRHKAGGEICHHEMAAYAVCESRRRGCTPEETVNLILDHPETIAAQVKAWRDRGALSEPRVRKDVMRLWKLPDERASPAEAFKGVNLGRDIIDVRSPINANIDETDADAWHSEMNKHFAVAKYASKIVIAKTSGDKLEFQELEDFHRSFANRFLQVVNAKGETKRVPVSKSWFTWEGRREYLNPGVVFEPGADSAPGMLNLWRGFGVNPTAGDWSLMQAHIRDVVCSGNEAHSDYLIKWMAYGVQHPDRPIGVAVALRGAQGAGKGILFRTFGSLFGQHFVHIAQGSQLTGRFNASLGNAVAVFLDEALWAGDRQGEGVLKALITEPTLQLEAKFRDPITVPNHLRIMIASNADWFVPIGTGDRRFFVLDVADIYAGTAHKVYWDALYGEIEHGGRAAMLHDLLAMDLTDFDVRAVPDTAAKTEQKLHSLRGTRAWLAHVLQEGDIGMYVWEESGLSIEKHGAYQHYVDFSKTRHEWQPELKDVWAKIMHKALGGCLTEARPLNDGVRRRMLVFRPLAECRTAFQGFIGAGGDAMAWVDN